MSGGHFDYLQYKIDEIAEDIKTVISKNDVEVSKTSHEKWDYDADGNLYPWAKYYYDFKPEVTEKFKEGYAILKKAYVYAQRIDWLLSGDDGEENFLKRLEEDLKELEEKLKKETFEYINDEED